MPDPFVLALLLTVGVAALALSVGEVASPAGWTLALAWMQEFSSSGLMAFALKMALILVTGHALALSAPVQRVVDAVARVPRSPGQAAAVVAFVACVTSLIHWGLGAIVGALVAREIGRASLRSGRPVHYPLLGAAAYAGFAVWHGGLSGSAPITVASAEHFLSATLADVGAPSMIPLGDTLWSPLNLVVNGVLLVAIPLLCAAMLPRDSAQWVAPDADAMRPLPAMQADADATGVQRWQQSVWLGRTIGAVGVGLFVAAVGSGRTGFDLDTVILGFLFLGISLHGDVVRYAAAVTDGARGAGAIILQFPFYFGILGLMKAGGLIAWLSAKLVSIATATTFPLVAFVSAGLVNLVVPSGGGQWVVQGELLLRAGAALGTSSATTVMAFAYGDAWTNMLQPFWALPLLGIMGLRARDIVGYTAMVFLLVGVVVPVALLALG
jgi:short-chain fatty acids transporter